MIDPAHMKGMTREEVATILADLKRDEGLRLKPYKDTVGKLTIGYGRNLDDRGISGHEAVVLLENDFLDALIETVRQFPWSRGLPVPQRRALVNMCFNLGLRRLSGFVKMLAALEAGDGELAAAEALDSKWAGQVGDRAERIAALYRDEG